MALTFIKETNTKNLVIFVHGFMGGNDTWTRSDGIKTIMSYLLEDQEFIKKFDIAVFDYFTKIFNFFKKSNVVAKTFRALFGNDSQSKKILPINEIAELLKTEISGKCVEYETIILIAHSMGGLVSKSYIINEIEKSNPKIKLFIALAVPHNGSEKAYWGRIIVHNPQIERLAPLNSFLNSLTTNWLQAHNSLPRTIYFEAKNDDVVPKESSIGFEAREKSNYRIEHLDSDHFTIITPKDIKDVLLIIIKQECYELLNQKAKPTTFQSKSNKNQSKIYDEETLKIINEHHKTEIKEIAQSQKSEYEKELINYPLFNRNIKEKIDNEYSFENFIPHIYDKKLILLYGIGGMGKSIILKRILVEFIDKFPNTFCVLCNAKEWKEEYTKGLDENKPIEERFYQLLSGLGSISFDDLERLNISKANKDVKKIFFLDGLNEIANDATRIKILNAVIDIYRTYDFQIILSTRYYNKNEFKGEWQPYEIQKMSRDELIKILRKEFSKDINSYTDANLEYLSLPFFLDLAIKSKKDLITGYSQYINEHVFKNIDTKLHDDYLIELSNLAYSAYLSSQKFIIPKATITPSLIKKYVKTKILVEDSSGGYKFEHHLINEFFVANKISREPNLWTNTTFDLITFEDRKSFEIIQMIIEQVTVKIKGEEYLKAVYDWNFYAALHCIKYVDDKCSPEFSVMLILILSEKLFDRFSHTRTRIFKYLEPLFFHLKGVKNKDWEKILTANDSEYINEFFQIIDSNKDFFEKSEYKSWYELFNWKNEWNEDLVAKIIDNDPMLGWSISNVLKRRPFDNNLEGQLILLFKTQDTPIKKWRIVHALGNGNSEKVVNFLISVLEQNSYMWLSFGTIRSLMEMALFNLNHQQCKETFDKLFSVLENIEFDKFVISELRSCLTDKVKTDKVPTVSYFYDRILNSNHVNFNEKDLWDNANKKYIEKNGN